MGKKSENRNQPSQKSRPGGMMADKHPYANPDCSQCHGTGEVWRIVDPDCNKDFVPCGCIVTPEDIERYNQEKKYDLGLL